MKQRGIEDTPFNEGDEAALMDPDEDSEEEPDLSPKNAEHGTLEGDSRKPSAPPERLYPNTEE